MPEHVLSRYQAQPVRILAPRIDGQRFAPYGYDYGESIKPPYNGAVRHEDIPYDNAKGFPTQTPRDSYDYDLAMKKQY